MSDDKVLKGVVKGLGQIGMETVENVVQEGGKIVESIITGKELLGLERTMTDAELEQKKRQESIKSQHEIAKLKGEVGKKKDDQKDENKVKEKPRNIEEELAQLRRQKEKEEEDKQRYYEEQKRQEEEQKRRQQEEYNSLNMESTNPAKQKKSRGSAFINKKQHKPDMTEMSATAEFKGNKVQ